jgi:hypothetical protein
MLAKNHKGYDLQCSVAKPQMPCLGAAIQREPNFFQSTFILEYEHIKKLLVASEYLNGAEFIDSNDLLKRARTIDALIGIPLQTDLVPDLIMAQDLPLDSATLLFSVLAVGAVLCGEYQYGRFCFEVATKLARRFIGPPSFDVCLAYFLQHGYVLHTGSSTHARTMVAQTVQACHDLALHNASHGVEGLHLYLLVYMADQ